MSLSQWGHDLARRKTTAFGLRFLVVAVIIGLTWSYHHHNWALFYKSLVGVGILVVETIRFILAKGPDDDPKDKQ